MVSLFIFFSFNLSPPEYWIHFFLNSQYWRRSLVLDVSHKYGFISLVCPQLLQLQGWKLVSKYFQSNNTCEKNTYCSCKKCKNLNQSQQKDCMQKVSKHLTRNPSVHSHMVVWKWTCKHPLLFTVAEQQQPLIKQWSSGFLKVKRDLCVISLFHRSQLECLAVK